MAEPKRMKYPTRNGDNVDRISDLPQPIIHQILSLLPPIDVIRTCLQSKSLQSSLSSYPVIDLDHSWFQADSSMIDVTYDKFISYVNGSIGRLKLDNTCLQKFRLRVQIPDGKQAAGIKKAIKFAIENRVKELDIDFVSPRFCVPQTIRSQGNSILILKLAGLKLHNLNELDMVCFWPLLENLSINSCTGIKSFKFSSTKIRSIALESCRGLGMVKIQSQSLQNFRYAGATKLMDIHDRCDINISECEVLKMLSIAYVCLTEHWVSDNIPKFLHLEDLELLNLEWSPSLIACENLKKLVWLGRPRYCVIRAPNLQSLTVNGIEFIAIGRCMNLKHLSCLGQITLDFLKENVSNMVGLKSLDLEFDVDCLLKCDLKRVETNCRKSSGLPRAVDKTLVVKFHDLELISFFEVEDSHLPKDIIDFRGQLLNVTLVIDSRGTLTYKYLVAFWNWIASFGHIKVFTLSCSSVQITPGLVDSFLSQSPNLEVLQFVSNGPQERSIEFEYGSRNGAEHYLPCCNGLSMKCWRHSLRKVALNNFDTAERDKLVKYFLDTAMLLNVIDNQSSSVEVYKRC